MKKGKGRRGLETPRRSGGIETLLDDDDLVEQLESEVPGDQPRVLAPPHSPPPPPTLPTGPGPEQPQRPDPAASAASAASPHLAVADADDEAEEDLPDLPPPPGGVALVPRLDPTPLRPIPFGNYTLLARVADGGMAEIFVAASNTGNDGPLLAIKRLHPYLVEDHRLVRSFEDEVRITAGLVHPQIVSIFEHGRDETGVPFLAMEFLPGATLKGMIRAALTHGSMPPLEIGVWVVARVGRALHHAHVVGVDGEPVVHGDISPENVLVTYGGMVKLLDFGVARTPAEGAGLGGGVQGKLSYMAPEAAFGDPVGPASDQFSLGVMLYELVTGQRVFRQHRTLEALREALRHPLPPPSTLQPGLPPELDQIITRACALRPADRFPDCRTLVTELENYLTHAGHYLTEEDLARYMQELFSGEFTGYRQWLREMLLGVPLQFPEERRENFTPVHGRRSTALPLSSAPTPRDGLPAWQPESMPVPPPGEKRPSSRWKANLLLFLLVLVLLLGALALVKLTEEQFPPAPAQPSRRTSASRAGLEEQPPAAARPATVPTPPTARSEGPRQPPPPSLQQSPPLPREPDGVSPPRSGLALPAAPTPMTAPTSPAPAAPPALGAPLTPAPARPVDGGGARLLHQGAAPSIQAPATPARGTGAESADLAPAAPGRGGSPGIVALSTAPSSTPVMVWEGGKPLGLTPLERAFTPGRHAVELKDLQGRLLQRLDLQVHSEATLVQRVALPQP